MALLRGDKTRPGELQFAGRKRRVLAVDGLDFGTDLIEGGVELVLELLIDGARNKLALEQAVEFGQCGRYRELPHANTGVFAFLSAPKTEDTNQGFMVSPCPTIVKATTPKVKARIWLR